MDRPIIDAKLESLRRSVRRVEEKRPENVEQLSADPDRQDVITLNLTRAVQLCVDLASHLIADSDERPPATMGDGFTTLNRIGIINEDLAARMRAAVGFRNVAVHNYQTIDWNIVFSIATRHLDDFRDFASAVVDWVER